MQAGQVISLMNQFFTFSTLLLQYLNSYMHSIFVSFILNTHEDWEDLTTGHVSILSSANLTDQLCMLLPLVSTKSHGCEQPASWEQGEHLT